MTRLLQKAVVACFLFHVAVGSVSPNSIFALVNPGQKKCYTKWVTVPDRPSKLDFMLVIDLSGSYRNDLAVFRNKAGAIFDGLAAATDNLRVGVATFRDYPKSPYGGRTDYAYRLHLNLTGNKALFLATIFSLSARGGADGPESQLEALDSLVNGHGGPFTGYCANIFHNCGSVNWRSDAAHVAALTTDNDAHDSEVDGMYPGAGKTAVIASLNSRDIAFVGIKAGSCFNCGWMDDVAVATGGAITTTDSSSNQIVNAIVSGIKEITFTVTGTPVGCKGVSVHLSPPFIRGVKAGQTVHFKECLTYDLDCADRPICDGDRTCAVVFRAGSLIVGVEKNLLKCGCKDGEFLDGDKCSPCPAGSISTDPPSDKCLRCGCGAVANAAHTECMDCPNANEASAADSDVCVTCGPGTYVSPDECRCLVCDIDFFCPGTGIPIPCPTGTFALPGSAECTPIECPDMPMSFSHTECDEWIVGDLDGHNPLPHHGLLLRNLFEYGSFGFTFQNDRTPAIGNEVLAFAVMDYCSGSHLKVSGLAYGGLLDATERPVAGESCEFSIEYTTVVSTSGPGNPGHVAVTDGTGWINCPSYPAVNLTGKMGPVQLELAAKYVNEWKANGWLSYPDKDWAVEDSRNSTPQDIDFVPLCKLPHTEDLVVTA